MLCHPAAAPTAPYRRVPVSANGQLFWNFQLGKPTLATESVTECNDAPSPSFVRSRLIIRLMAVENWRRASFLSDLQALFSDWFWAMTKKSMATCCLQLIPRLYNNHDEASQDQIMCIQNSSGSLRIPNLRNTGKLVNVIWGIKFLTPYAKLN